jgi:transposase
MEGNEPKRRRTTSRADIEAISNALLQGSDTKMVGLALGMTGRVIRRVKRRLLDAYGEPFQLKRRGGAHHTVWTDALRGQLLAIVELHNDYTLEEIRTALQAATPPGSRIPSVSSIWQKLDGELITLKDAHWIPQMRNTPETKATRKTFVQQMSAEDPHVILLYFDECGYCLWTRRTKARAPRGQPAHVVAPVAQHDVVNVLAAISPMHGWIYHEIVEHTVKAEQVAHFLHGLRARVNELFVHEEVLLVLDNAHIHRPADVAAEFGEERRRFRFLPPYSPFLNPIEESFSAMKAEIKHQLRMRHEEILAIQGLPWGQKSLRRRQILAEVLPAAVLTITPAMCANFYAHTLSFYPAYLAEMHIL